MVNNLLLLCLFAAACVLLYHLLPKKKAVKLAALQLFGAVFYILCDWRAFFVLLFVTVYTYYAAIWISRRQEQPKRKKMLAVGIIPPLCVLFVSKYIGVFDALVTKLFGADLLSDAVVSLVSFLGISYYTFKVVSYLVDVYRNKYACERNFLMVSVYITFFPQIVSGPIQRFDSFGDSFADLGYKRDLFMSGLGEILLGLYMKSVIADRLSGYVSEVFENYASVNGLALWLGAFFFTIQLYCDFAGYSYVAIGFTKLFGIDCPKNFNAPFFSRSIKEFWNRWHISLSSWLRDYVYFPLGGSRCSKYRRFFNILVTFLVSGLWHGAGLHYAVWGLLNGLLVYFYSKKFSESKNPFAVVFSTLLTFLATMLTLIVFRSSSLSAAFVYLKRMVTAFSLNMTAIQSAVLPFTSDNTCIAFFLTAVFFILITAWHEFRIVYPPKRRSEKTAEVLSYVWYIFMLTSVILFGQFGNDFIYGNF